MAKQHKQVCRTKREITRVSAQNASFLNVSSVQNSPAYRTVDCISIFANISMELCGFKGILLAWRAAAAVAMGGALYFSKRSSVIEEADDDDEDR